MLSFVLKENVLDGCNNLQAIDLSLSNRKTVIEVNKYIKNKKIRLFSEFVSNINI